MGLDQRESDLNLEMSRIRIDFGEDRGDKRSFLGYIMELNKTSEQLVERAS